MTQFRIRSVSENTATPWVYTQEIVEQQVSDPVSDPVAPISLLAIPALLTTSTLSTTSTNIETNQFGRFRYGEKQYGILTKDITSSLEFDKTPMRIRFNNGSYLYTQNVTKQGAVRGVRIRSIIDNTPNEWTYSQTEEV